MNFKTAFLVALGSLLSMTRLPANDAAALYDAANGGDLAAVTDLLAKGAAVNAGSGPYRFTPLMGAESGGHLDILAYLLAHGAKIDQGDSQGSTALLHACFDNQADSALALLKAGANPNIGSRWKRFPLMFAAWNGNDVIASALIAAKADLNATCSDGPALFWAADKDHLSTAKLLLDAGAAPTGFEAGLDQGKMHRTLLGTAASVGDEQIIDLLISKGCDVNAPATDGNTPLMTAASNNSAHGIEVLLLKGAKIDAQNQSGRTALQVALIHKCKDAFEALLSYRPNIEIKDKWGFTPLIRACYMRENHLAEELILRRADINAVDNQGETALTHAGNMGEFDMVKVLEAHGATRTDLHIIPAEAPPQPLSPAHAWALAVGAVYTQRDNENHKRLGGLRLVDFAPADITPADITDADIANTEEAKDMLLHSWKITNKAGLVKEIDDLQHHGHHEEYEKDGTGLLMMAPEQYQKYLAAHPGHAAQIKAMKQSFETWKGRSGLAWDLCRASMLVNHAFAAHYINEKEAWDLLMPIARQTQQNFSSWKEMSDNFLDGRQIWDNQQSTYMIVCSDLLLDPKDPNSPWNYLPWQTDLAGN